MKDYGVSFTTDGWKSKAGMKLVNAMIVTKSGSYFQNSVNCSGLDVDEVQNAEFVAKMISLRLTRSVQSTWCRSLGCRAGSVRAGSG